MVVKEALPKSSKKRKKSKKKVETVQRSSSENSVFDIIHLEPSTIHSATYLSVSSGDALGKAGSTAFDSTSDHSVKNLYDSTANSFISNYEGGTEEASYIRRPSDSASIETPSVKIRHRSSKKERNLKGVVIIVPHDPNDADHLLYISGSTEYFGCWNPHQSLPLTLEGDYWKFESYNLPYIEEVEFKIIGKEVENRSRVGWWEAGENHKFGPLVQGLVIVVHPKRSIDIPLDIYSTAAFRNVIFGQDTLEPNDTLPFALSNAIGKCTVRFTVSCVCLPRGYSLYLAGGDAVMGAWDIDAAIPLVRAANRNEWMTEVEMESKDVKYKYVMRDDMAGLESAVWEAGEDRIARLSILDTVIMNAAVSQMDGEFRYESGLWRGAGVQVPVFSLRSKQGVGIGEFLDLKLLADFCVESALSLIQILPINDSAVYNDWRDSYPYSTLSSIALHPIYISLLQLCGKYDIADFDEEIEAKMVELDGPQVRYEEVYAFKMDVLRRVYDKYGSKVVGKEVTAFIASQSKWIKGYALFKYFCQCYGTTDHSTWPTYSQITKEEVEQLAEAHHWDLMVYYWIQYELDDQLRDAVTYATNLGVVLKGDLPIGVSPHSCDVWLQPELFHRNMQTGAPPDYFAAEGQNWGFPTYHWEAMEREGYGWWKTRLAHMERFFQAYRIDHVLGFFRIWEIPVDCERGILGHFHPALPITKEEFEACGIWDMDALCRPYIDTAYLATRCKDALLPLLDEFAYMEGAIPCLKPAFQSEKAIRAHVEGMEDWFGMEKEELIEVLFSIVSDVVLLRDQAYPEYLFHMRIDMFSTRSFQSLEPRIQDALSTLYNDYFYARQDELWRESGRKKLQFMTQSTSMLTCAEDLGMIPQCTKEVLEAQQAIGLRVQRMPRDMHAAFDDCQAYPYLSVAMPGSHDTSTLRGWWLEDQEASQLYYNTVLKQPGKAPLEADPTIVKMIVEEHLRAESIWVIIPLQDLLSLVEGLNHADPELDRINIPAERHHYWRYRCKVSLEQMLSQDYYESQDIGKVRGEIHGLIQASGRQYCGLDSDWA